jgi:N-glycosylase/DNA lyase
VVYGNLIRIRQPITEETGDASQVELDSTPETDPERLELLLRSYFRLDDDIEAIYRQIDWDHRVAEMVEKYRGLRLLRQEPWECFVAFICSSNSNIPRIHANMESLADSFGHPLHLDGQVRHTFPTPERLAEAGEAALRALGLGFRAKYLARAAIMVADGSLSLESLRDLPYEDAKAALMEVPGIGPKVADCILLHSLEKLEAFPIDVWVRRALKDWYFQDRKPPTDPRMLEWAQEYFGPLGGYAQMYLFHGRRLKG